MIYILFCSEKEILNSEIKSISKDSDIIHFEFSKENIFEIINELLSVDLFDTKKTFVIENPTIMEIKSHGVNNKSIALFENAIKKSEYNVIFVLKKELNLSLPFVQNIVGCYEYRKFDNIQKDVSMHIDSIISKNNIKIDSVSLDLLKLNLDNNLLSIKSELEKLSLISDESTITEQIINENSYSTVSSDVFKFIEKIFLNNQSDAKYIYDSLIEEGNNPVTLIELFATQIKFYYQVKLLSRDYNSKEITTLLKANPYRINKAMQLINKVSVFSIIKKYQQTAELEFLAKSGRINQNLIFDLLIQK